MVIFHSYVSLPEGIPNKNNTSDQQKLGMLSTYARFTQARHNLNGKGSKDQDEGVNGAKCSNSISPYLCSSGAIS